MKNKLYLILFIISLFVALYLLRLPNFTEFTDGHQSIKLYKNNTFVANLYHGKVFKGNYEKSPLGISLFVGDKIYFAEIIDDSEFILPIEWSDDHHHNRNLVLKK